jgi:hypothetical protein
LLSLLTCAGVAASITLFQLGMRALMGIGGTCAEGGGYLTRVSCPSGTVFMGPAVIGWLLFSFGFGVVTGLVSVALLSFGVFMLALAMTIFGAAFPGQGHPVQVTGIIMFIMFGAFGSIPFIAGGRGLLYWLKTGVEPKADGNATARPLAAPTGEGAEDESRPHTGVDVAAELERLADLHRHGDLTDDEYALAKRKALGKDS